MHLKGISESFLILTQMKTVFIREYGGAENLEIRDISDPDPPGENEVLVRVVAAGLNRADVLQRQGLYPPPPGFDPRRPGLEFAGFIEAIGEAVEDFRIRDTVCGITAGEAQSEFVVVDQRVVVHIPDLEVLDMAAVPEAFVTAHDALFTRANLGSDDTVLIHAVASGVGLAAAQIARAKGAFVIGTTRDANKAEILNDDRSLIASWIDRVLLTAEDPPFSEMVMDITAGRGASVIIDLVGGRYFGENLRSIGLQGRMVLIGLIGGRKAEFDMSIALAKRLTISGTVLRSRTLEEKAAAIEGFRKDLIPGFSDDMGRYKPVIDRIFEVDDVREAHEYIESNRNIGKVVLRFQS